MTSSAVKMSLSWVVPLGESRSITEALHRLMLGARAKRGCLGCSVTTDMGRRVGLRYVEEWATEDLLRQELRSERFCSLAALMEYATEPPRVEITLPGEVRGLDYVEEVRSIDAV